MKIVVTERRIRVLVNVDAMQFGFYQAEVGIVCCEKNAIEILR